MLKESYCIFSSDRAYRYVLVRRWGNGRRFLCFVMLNPSTADENVNDPTVERCMRRAMKMGFDGLIVLNLFATRSTDPKLLYEVVVAGGDPVGPENDRYLLEYTLKASMIILGWGKDGKLLERGKTVWRMLRNVHTLNCLKVNGDGNPQHPLYIGYGTGPKPFPGWPEDEAAAAA